MQIGRKVGKRYLTVDPMQAPRGSRGAMDVNLVWARRIPVTLVAKHSWALRNKYDVRGDDGKEWSTNVLQRYQGPVVRR
jgi:hypothetical protein